MLSCHSLTWICLGKSLKEALKRLIFSLLWYCISQIWNEIHASPWNAMNSINYLFCFYFYCILDVKYFHVEKGSLPYSLHDKHELVRCLIMFIYLLVYVCIMYEYILWDICGGQFSPSTIGLTARTFTQSAFFPVTLHVFKNLYMYVFKFQVQGSQWSVSTVQITHQVSTKIRQLGKLCLASITSKVLFLFVLILGVLHSRNSSMGSLAYAFWGFQVDFIYVNKTEKVVVWSCYCLC